jgi:hypothetical protein
MDIQREKSWEDNDTSEFIFMVVINFIMSR